MSLQETSITFNDSFYRYYYLCNYLPLSAGVDPLSRSLLKFKRGIQPDLDAWIECTLEVFHNIPLSPDTIIIRALRHDETQVHKSPPAALDLLGQALAAAFQCQYLPSLLRKSRPTLSNKGLTREQRETELNEVYSIAPEMLPSSAPSLPPFLLVDDILTTGSTIRTIIHTLHQTFPFSPLQIFTLAKVDHDPGFNRSSPPHSQNYHLEADAGWILAEDRAPYAPAEDSAPYAPAEAQIPDLSLDDKKIAIRANFR